MDDDTKARGRPPMADCPYCQGEGTGPDSAAGMCKVCYGTGRVARIFAERVLARWARNGRLNDRVVPLRRVEDEGVGEDRTA